MRSISLLNLLLTIAAAMVFSNTHAQVKDDSNITASAGLIPEPPYKTTGSLLTRVSHYTTLYHYGAAKRVDYTTPKGSYSTRNDSTRMGIPSKEGLTGINVQLENGGSIMIKVNVGPQRINLANMNPLRDVPSGMMSYKGPDGSNTLVKKNYGASAVWLTAQGEGIYSKGDTRLLFVGEVIYLEVFYSEHAASPEIVKAYKEQQQRLWEQGGKARFEKAQQELRAVLKATDDSARRMRNKDSIAADKTASGNLLVHNKDGSVTMSARTIPAPPQRTTGNLLMRISERTSKAGYGATKRVDYTTNMGSYSTLDDTTKMGIPSKEFLRDINVQLENGGSIKVINGLFTYNDPNGKSNTIMRDTYKGKGNGAWLTAQGRPISMSGSDGNLWSLGTEINFQVLTTERAATPELIKAYQEQQRQLKEQQLKEQQKELEEKLKINFDGAHLRMTLADALKTLEARGYKLNQLPTTVRKVGQYKNIDIEIYTIMLKAESKADLALDNAIQMSFGMSTRTGFVKLARTDNNGYHYQVTLHCSEALIPNLDVFQKVSQVTGIDGHIDMPGITISEKYLEIGKQRYPNAKVASHEFDTVTDGVILEPSEKGLDLSIIDDVYAQSLRDQILEQAYQTGLKKQKNMPAPKF